MSDGKYARVIPRDFFNESKLLKCLGQFVIKHEVCPAVYERLSIEFDNEPFDIRQNEDDGELFVLNFEVATRAEPYLSVWLFSRYNSKSPYPLVFRFAPEDSVDELSGDVFTDEGEFTQEFIDAIS